MMYKVFALTLALGALLGWLFYRLIQITMKKTAEIEAQDILQTARDKSELQLLDEKEKTQEIELDLWARDEKFLLDLEEKIENLQEMVDEKKRKLDNVYSVERGKTVQFETEVQKNTKQVEDLQRKLDDIRKSKLDQVQKFIGSLSQKSQLPKESVIEEIKAKIVEQVQKESAVKAEQLEEDAKEHAEQKVKKILDTALDRFARAYSSERGIAPVYFPSPKAKTFLCDAEGNNVKLISDLTGCDIIIQDESDMIGVAGFDPVRRELVRRVLERLIFLNKQINADTIRKTFEYQKQDLFKQIRSDGDAVAKELKLEKLHPEIRQMMGSLRHRYSFTQNQYFHCAEVGWLCGLLASELGGVEIKKARRSGLLHDLGKAMDHELDGGHAVIGADFIQQRGEAPDIVHAVKSHHYDEQPATDLAYLVIAADAISGARPGARRSTIEAYNQKVTELERIAKSFHGVVDCYILSGGREVRVIANGKQVNDSVALKLSKEIAQKIEAECQYPGQIKVVVVRETVVTEGTKVG